MSEQYDPALGYRDDRYETVWPYRRYEPAPQVAPGTDWMPTHSQARAKGQSLAERILEALMGGSRTRSEICRALRLSPTTVCRILTPLIDDGRVLLDVLPPRQGTKGKNQYSYRRGKVNVDKI